MSRRDDDATVLGVACLTEDRDPSEMRAMLAVALELDADFGSFAQRNWRGDRTPLPPRYVSLVLDTYSPEGRGVGLNGAQRAKYRKLMEKWQWCVSCGVPVGMHGADGCRKRPTIEHVEHVQRLTAVMAQRAGIETLNAPLVGL